MSSPAETALHFIQVIYAHRLRCHGEAAARAWLETEMPHSRIVGFLPWPTRAATIAQLQADALTAALVPFPT